MLEEDLFDLKTEVKLVKHAIASEDPLSLPIKHTVTITEEKKHEQNDEMLWTSSIDSLLANPFGEVTEVRDKPSSSRFIDQLKEEHRQKRSHLQNKLIRATIKLFYNMA